MLQLEDAIVTAREALPRVFPESEKLELKLEGVEKTDDERFWLVTLSYPRPDWTIITSIREYRTVKLRAEDGELMGVRNGVLSSAA